MSTKAGIVSWTRRGTPIFAGPTMFVTMRVVGWVWVEWNCVLKLIDAKYLISTQVITNNSFRGSHRYVNSPNLRQSLLICFPSDLQITIIISNNTAPRILANASGWTKLLNESYGHCTLEPLRGAVTRLQYLPGRFRLVQKSGCLPKKKSFVQNKTSFILILRNSINSILISFQVL